MIAVVPGRFIAAQKVQEFSTADGFASRLDEESVAAAQNYEGINLASEVFREKDVGAPIANGFHRVPS